MRHAILQTGEPPQKLLVEHGDYPTMFQTILPALETEVFRVKAGELPDPAAFKGAIITGSSAGVYDDDPWIGDLLDWIRKARGRTRLVGVCFGHQAMAQALGGRVIKSDKGWGVGLHRYQVVADEPWMTPSAESVSIPVSHQDQVVEKPADARVTLASDFTPFAGLAYGADAISFQCHPEFTPTYAAALVEGRRGSRVPEAMADQAIGSLRQADDRALVSGWIRTFLTA